MRVSGDIDLSCAETVEDACAACLARDETSAVVIDLSGTGFLDSSGIAMLFRVHRLARSAGIPLSIVACTPRVVRSLEITGAATTLALADSLSAACAAARNGADGRSVGRPPGSAH